LLHFIYNYNIFFLLLNNKMVRPRRLYKDSKGRYFYIVNNQQKFVKVPKDMAEKDVVKISLKTLENLINKRRVKKRKKRQPYAFEKPVVTGAPTPGPSKLVVEGRKIPQIEDIVKNTKQKKAEQLAENVESFFDTLANKKTGLLSGTKLITQGEKGVSQEKVADELPSAEKGDGSLDKLEPGLKKIAKKIIKLAGSYEGFIKVYGKEKTIEGPNFRTFTQNALKLFPELSESDKNQLIQTLAKNKQLEENWLQGENQRQKAEPLTEEEKKALEELGNQRKQEKEQSAPTPTPPAQPKPPAKPAAEQIRNIKKAIRKPRDTSGLMPSLRTPAKTTEEKLAETPSFSATAPSGTEAPPAPLSTKTSTSPMDESIAEQVRREVAIEEKTRSLMGLGEDGDDALYNDEIAKIIKKRVGKVVPVIPSDKVKYLKDYVKRGDKSFAAVINTNPSESDGTGQDGFQVGHWRAIFVDNRDDYPSIEYFDPLVSTPEKELVIELKKIAKKMNPERMFLYKENRLQRQAKQASTCGYHAAQFVDDRMNGESWCSATGYDDFVNRMGQVDDSADGEQEIRKTIKKYKVYL
jgi:hypothetical protein